MYNNLKCSFDDGKDSFNLAQVYNYPTLYSIYKTMCVQIKMKTEEFSLMYMFCMFITLICSLLIINFNWFKNAYIFCKVIKIYITAVVVKAFK